MSATCTIYALSDPRNRCEIRYIGKTRGSLNKRLCQHLADANRRKRQSKQLSWVNSLLAQNIRPLIWPLEICPTHQWAEREAHWIWFFKPLGKLTNLTVGGNGCHEMPPTTMSTRVKQRLSHLNKSWPLTHARLNPNFKYNLSESQKRSLALGVEATRIPIRCVTNGKVFKSIADAARSVGVTHSKITQAISRRGTCRKLVWEYC